MSTTDNYLGPDWLQIAPDVAALLGAEVVERYRTSPHLTQGECHACGKATDPTVAPVTLAVLVIPEAARQAGDPHYVAIPRHAACSPSELLLWEDPIPGSLDEISIRAGAWPESDGNLRPVLLLGFPECVGYSNGPDRAPTDLLATLHLMRGWDLVTRMGHPPTATKTVGVFWQLAPQANTTEGAGPGRLSVINLHHGNAEDYVADTTDWWASPWWTAAVSAGQHVDVYAGPLGPVIMAAEIDYAALQRVAKTGRVTATRAAAVVLDHQGQPIANHRHP